MMILMLSPAKLPRGAGELIIDSEAILMTRSATTYHLAGAKVKVNRVKVRPHCTVMRAILAD